MSNILKIFLSTQFQNVIEITIDTAFRRTHAIRIKKLSVTTHRKYARESVYRLYPFFIKQENSPSCIFFFLSFYVPLTARPFYPFAKPEILQAARCFLSLMQCDSVQRKCEAERWKLKQRFYAKSRYVALCLWRNSSYHVTMYTIRAGKSHEGSRN